MIYANDSFGNLNSTTLTFSVNVILNSAPSNPVVNINSTDRTNYSLVDLNCFANIYDLNDDSINLTVQWYKNNALNLSFDYNNSYSNGSFFTTTLEYENTSVYDNWSCGMRLFDGENYSAWSNSSLLYIQNVLPSNVSARIYPTTAYLTSTLEGYCNGSDYEGSNITYYYIWFKNDSINSSGTSSNHLSSIEYNLNNISSNLTSLNDNWTFSCLANDGNSNSTNWSNTSVIIIQQSSTPSSPSSGGGGGQVNIIDLGNLTINYTKEIIEFGDTYKITVVQEEHSVKISKIDLIERTVKLYIRSTPFYLILSEGESRDLDLNADNINETNIKLNKIINETSADISIKEISSSSKIVHEEEQIVEEISSEIETATEEIAEDSQINLFHIITYGAGILFVSSILSIIFIFYTKIKSSKNNPDKIKSLQTINKKEKNKKEEYIVKTQHEYSTREEAKEYIQFMRIKGYSSQQIISLLREYGWTDKQISQLMPSSKNN